jgi:hypothetical protein
MRTKVVYRPVWLTVAKCLVIVEFRTLKCAPCSCWPGLTIVLICRPLTGAEFLASGSGSILGAAAPASAAPKPALRQVPRAGESEPRSTTCRPPGRQGTGRSVRICTARITVHLARRFGDRELGDRGSHHVLLHSSSGHRALTR